jgi:hypothetical protein
LAPTDARVRRLACRKPYFGRIDTPSRAAQESSVTKSWVYRLSADSIQNGWRERGRRIPTATLPKSRTHFPSGPATSRHGTGKELGSSPGRFAKLG